jgi:hypothetical protein
LHEEVARSSAAIDAQRVEFNAASTNSVDEINHFMRDTLERRARNVCTRRTTRET